MPPQTPCRSPTKACTPVCRSGCMTPTPASG